MWGTSRSFLKFTDDTEPELVQHAVTADLSWHFRSLRSLGISAGAVVGGEFSFADTTVRVVAGPVVSFRFSKILLVEYRAIPFIVAAISASGSWTAAEWARHDNVSLAATDARLSFTIGYTIAERVQLFIAPKVFGGPAFRMADGEAVRGSDRFFFQAGLGATLLLPREIMVFVNGSPLGEQAIGGGVSMIF